MAGNLKGLFLVPTLVLDFDGNGGARSSVREDNSRFGGELTHTIRLPINKIRTPQSQHHVSFGYQPCAARLTLPRRLIPACESKNTSKNKEERN
uniref:BIO1 n=1 Tax=Arundo donax TaxID=35708 RepID=A0A0A9DEF4_ARUDO